VTWAHGPAGSEGDLCADGEEVVLHGASRLEVDLLLHHHGDLPHDAGRLGRLNAESRGQSPGGILGIAR
jgi:hypothetical protein